MADITPPRALEAAIRKYALNTVTAFSGRGQTLGGGPAPVDFGHNIKNTFYDANRTLSGLDPQLKILLLLVGSYGLFWYLS